MTSIVRRGNHFIQLDDQWCLIDGPWFDYLERFSGGGRAPVCLAYYDDQSPMPLSMMTDDEMYAHLSTNNLRIVEWEPRMWHPGFTTPWRGPWRSIGEALLQERWHRWNKGRMRLGFTLLPDGRLPEFFAGPALNGTEDAYWWYDAWGWYDGYEYYTRWNGKDVEIVEL